MILDHTKLDVYQRALELLDQLDLVYELIGTSVVLNIAEGAGEFSPPEKQLFYRMARRSAVETAAVLDILERRRSLPAETLQPARELVVRVVSMLVRLAAK